MLDFIYKNLDQSSKSPTAVLCALIDFSKAFNRIDHNILVTILSDLNIPTCALRLVISYLTGRKMCVRYGGATSVEQKIPGGGPQGGLLTVIFFNLQVNLAGVPCPLPRSLPVGTLGPEPCHPQPGPLPPCHQNKITMKKKYVDDLSMLESLNLKMTLVPSSTIIGPRNIHETSGLHLPVENSVLHHQLADLAEFTEKNKMKINIKKSKIISFNLTKIYDFLPQLFFPHCDPLEVIYETKLLGVTLSSDLSWSKHIDTITKRATRNLWVLIRFKTLGGTTHQLVQVYITRVRSILEFAAPVFHSSLTRIQSHKVETVQKKAFAIILGKDYCSYESSLSNLELERLDSRREKLCLSFAKKCLDNPNHQLMFPPNVTARDNMRNPKPYLEPQCNTSRYYNSSLPYMTRLLNRNP